MESIKKLKLTTFKSKMFLSLLVLLGLFLLIIQDAFSYSVNLERVLYSTVYNPYWENAGVSSSNREDTYIASFSNPGKANTRRLVFISAGQQFASGSGNSLTGQANEWQDTYGSNPALSNNSLAGALINRGYVNTANTFMAMALDSQFNWENSEAEKTDMENAYYNWLKDQFVASNMEWILLAGHSRGGVLILRLAQRFNTDFPNIRLYVQAYDPVPNTTLQGELYTTYGLGRGVKVYRPQSDKYWGFKMDMKNVFANRNVNKLSVLTFVGGDEFSGTHLTGVHPLSHKDALTWDYYNGWYRQIWSQDIGHMEVDNNWELALKHFEFKPNYIASAYGQVKYQARSDTQGWGAWEADGDVAGTVGESQQMDKIKIELAGSAAGYTVEYRVHCAGGGWQDWKQNGAEAYYRNWLGTYRRIEAIQIRLVNQPADLHIKYRAHLEDTGWQGWVSDGTTAGTTGESRRLEAIRIMLVKDDFKINGSDAASIYINNETRDPIYLYGRRVDSEGFFVSVLKSNASWGGTGTEYMAWLDNKGNDELQAGTFDLREFCSGKFALESNAYYRVKIADNNGWDEKVLLIFLFDPTETEPNNTKAEADSYKFGTTCYGITDSVSSQADWYGFSYTSASRLILNLKGLTAPYVSLTLYKNDQQIVVVNSGSTVNIAFPGAGTYYIRVTGYTGVKYSFSVTHLC